MAVEKDVLTLQVVRSFRRLEVRPPAQVSKMGYAFSPPDHGIGRDS